MAETNGTSGSDSQNRRPNYWLLPCSQGLRRCETRWPMAAGRPTATMEEGGAVFKVPIKGARVVPEGREAVIAGNAENRDTRGGKNPGARWRVMIRPRVQSTPRGMLG